MPVTMNPIEPTAETAILVGDPRRAFALAQALTVQPRMTHQARGLWGYQGNTELGMPLTVQSTGQGGPSAVAVISDLFDQGLTRAVRLGTCLALDPDLALGTILNVSRAIGRDGASQSLGCREAAVPDPELSKVLTGVGRPGVVSSHDLVGRLDRQDPEAERSEPIAVARDLQTAAMLTITAASKIPAAAFLIVAEDHEGDRLDEQNLWRRFEALGREIVERLESPGAKSQPSNANPNPQVKT